MDNAVKWHPFFRDKGYHQKRPPMRKWVVVQLAAKEPEVVRLPNLKPGVPNLVMTLPPGIAVGYRKDAAGDASCPYFVIPGIGGEVTAWCDCLPDNFDIPNTREPAGVTITAVEGA